MMKFEVTKDAGRKPRWNLRDGATGHVVPLKLGRVHLPPTIAENRRIRDAVDQVLARMARDHGIEAAKG